MSLVFAFLAGLLTLINPCVLPILPVVLASALQAHRLGPIALTFGMAASFVVFGLTIAVAGRALGLSSAMLSQVAAFLMLGFGLTLLIPALGTAFTRLTAPIAARADHRIDTIDRSGLTGQALTGVLLGAVWNPCVGPTLGGAVGLASQGKDIGHAALIMTAFAAGVVAIMLALAYGARATLMRRRTAMRAATSWAKPVMGVVLVAIGLMILTNFHHRIEGWALSVLPLWLQNLSVTL